MEAPTPVPVSVRHWFRQLRAADHLRDADALDAIRTYARGQHAIVCVRRVAPPHAITLYDTDMPPGIDIAARARTVHAHGGFPGLTGRPRQTWVLD